MDHSIPFTPAESCALTLLGESSLRSEGVHPMRPLFLFIDTESRYQPDLPNACHAFMATPLDTSLAKQADRIDYLADGARGLVRIQGNPQIDGALPFPPDTLESLKTLLPAPYSSALAKLQSGQYRIAVPLPVEEEALNTPTPAIKRAIQQWNALHPETIPGQIEPVADTPYLMLAPNDYNTLFDTWFKAMDRLILAQHSTAPSTALSIGTTSVPPSISLALRPFFAPADASANAYAIVSDIPDTLPSLKEAKSRITARYNAHASALLDPVHQCFEHAKANDELCHVPLLAMYAFSGALRHARPNERGIPTPPDPYNNLISNCAKRDFTIIWPLRGAAHSLQPLIDQLNYHFQLYPYGLDLRATGPESSAVLMSPSALNELHAAWNSLPHPTPNNIKHTGRIAVFPSRQQPDLP